MTPVTKAISSWRRLPEPTRFAAIETLRIELRVATKNAVDDPGFASAWRDEAKGLRVAIRLLKAAEKKRKVNR